MTPFTNKKIGIIFNPASGLVKRLEEIKLFCAQLEKENIKVEIREITETKKAYDISKQFVEEGFNVIVAAGGDGTLNAVARPLLSKNILFAILPLGTRNHLAKDLKIPLDLNEALKLITGEHEIIKIDVGSCNGNIFLNNSGLGLYPRMIELREEFQMSKYLNWLAFLLTLFHLKRKIPKFYMNLKIAKETISKKTSFVFVGNNIYGLGGLKTGTRDSLSDGLLSAWVSHRSSFWGLFELFFHAIFGNVEEHRDFDVFEAEELEVETKRKMVSVSFDGEIERLESPLKYHILPKSLQVIVSPYLRENS